MTLRGVVQSVVHTSVVNFGQSSQNLDGTIVGFVCVLDFLKILGHYTLFPLLWPGLTVDEEVD